MSRFFGTDGLRGRANVDLTPELAVRVGLAAGRVLGGEHPGTIILGRDTRESGPMLEAAVAAGLASAGWKVRLAGVMTSPGVACLTTLSRARAGCVISASHNPAPDNGIKFFNERGAKLDVPVEERIEQLLVASADAGADWRPNPGSIRSLTDPVGRYQTFLRDTIEGDLSGLRLVVDCANGASSRIAPALLRSLGADVVSFYDHPDGRNINAGCGATRPAHLKEALRREGGHIGIAFDGDADRAILVDETGTVRNGDHILYLLGRERLASGRLPGGAVVGTVMTNLGAERAMADAGIRLERARVGDREVFSRMLAMGAAIGGEQSGHIIFPEHLNTGDGILTAIQVLAAVRRAGRPLSELCAPVTMFPQILINIPLDPDLDWRGATPLGKALSEAEALILPAGRILVRPSGTEPILRVMLESPDPAALHRAADGVQETVDSPGITRQFLSADFGE